MTEIIRMIKEKRANCTGCYGCYNACQLQAIEMVEDEEGFRYPKINDTQCVNCGACEKACPMLNPPQVRGKEKPNAYAAINEDEEIREKSSSGGMFHLLAEEVLNEGGIVFGAGFDEKWEVSHQSAESLEELSKLRVSKYLQSRAEDVYIQVRQELKNGRKVLFTGTPCQGAALQTFLKHDYPNLLTADFICHGVPSPAVWRRYLAWRTSGEEIREISFRNKNLSWERYLLAIFCKNTNKYLSADIYHDLYLKGFLQNLYLRPSCHECRFCRANRPVDITMADFWGVKRVVPDMYDGRGTSMVIIHSQKGQEIFDRISARKEQVAFECVVKHNITMVKPVTQSLKREFFYRDFTAGELGIDILLEKYTRLPLMQRIKNACKNVPGLVKLYRFFTMWDNRG